MHRFVALALAAAAVIAGPAHAQDPLKPDTPSVLEWTPAQRAMWYPAMETVYRAKVVKRGGRVRLLPKARHQIEPAFSYGGKTFTVDDYMKAYNVSGVLVLKGGRILLERYGMGRKPQDRWTSFSVAKSVTSTLVGAAIRDGKIKGLSAPVVDYIPELKGSAYEGVTVRQLLMMSSGVKWNEDYADPNSDVARAGFVDNEPGMNPMVGYMRKLPRAKPPGTFFNYSTGETDLVGVLVSNAVGKPLSEYASEKLWKTYGMERDAIWMVDTAGHERGGCCMSMTLRDYGRVGQFILEDGRAGGRRVLPPGWVAEATSPQIKDGAPAPGYGYFWWMRPQGGFEARGIFGQAVMIVPEERLVVVVNSAWPAATGKELSAARAAFLEAIRAAARGV
jgi:CubicO group peptidase (beta-lactamase class C family)